MDAHFILETIVSSNGFGFGACAVVPPVIINLCNDRDKSCSFNIIFNVNKNENNNLSFSNNDLHTASYNLYVKSLFKDRHLLAIDFIIPLKSSFSITHF